MLEKTLNTYPAALSAFAVDVISGLSGNPKSLPSRWFYDDNGSKLFRQIMQMPEYYLTRAEYEALDTYKTNIVEFMADEEFNLIEFGAGDGLKTKILLREALKQNKKLNYFPIDISMKSLKELIASINSVFPSLFSEGLNKDYFEAMEFIKREKSGKRSFALFLGSNIGNFSNDEAIVFLKKMRSFMNSGDMTLIGFDMIKNPFLIKRAYDDNKGITRSFNLNLLERINRELTADFDVNEFEHYPEYSPLTGAARSYLVSLKKQKVFIEKLAISVEFEEGEPIYTEISQKYNLEMIKNLASKSGFSILSNFGSSYVPYNLSMWNAI